MNKNDKNKNKNKNDKKNSAKRTFNPNNYKAIGQNEERVATYNGTSVRAFGQAVRDLGMDNLPKLYRFCCSLPVRLEGTGRVIVEGKYEIGCYWRNRPMGLSRFIAQLGYKLPTKGTAKRCDELIADYKDAIAQRGKYAPKAPKASK